ncbi:MAG: GNAT family N-acetyltransferase [Candidatus Thorarchaeota archaeon]
MQSFERANKSHKSLLVDMYLEDIADNGELAVQFADVLINSLRTILSFYDGELSGTLSWEIRGGPDDGVIELAAMGVRDAYKRKGVGSSLVKEMLSQAAEEFNEKGYEIRRVFLFMEHSNEPAREFYKSLGFVESATLQEFYPSEDASIWVLQVNPSL